MLGLMLYTHSFACLRLDGDCLSQAGMMNGNTVGFLCCGWGPHSPNCPYLKGFRNYTNQTGGCPETWEQMRGDD